MTMHSPTHTWYESLIYSRLNNFAQLCSYPKQLIYLQHFVPSLRRRTSWICFILCNHWWRYFLSLHLIVEYSCHYHPSLIILNFLGISREGFYYYLQSFDSVATNILLTAFAEGSTTIQILCRGSVLSPHNPCTFS
jgi:hypothetical protein